MIKKASIIIFLLLSLYLGVNAQDSNEYSDYTTYEYSLQLLNNITGNIPQLSNLVNQQTTRLGDLAGLLFRLYTQGVFFFVVLMGAWSIIQVVILTANEGKFMGAKMSQGGYFLWFRTIAALVLFAPISSTAYTYSIVQILINSVTIQGVILANSAWSILATAMIAYSGGIGNIIVGLGGLSGELANMQNSLTSAQSTNQSAENLKNDLNSLLYNTSTGTNAFTTSSTQFASSLISSNYCVYHTINIKSGSMDDYNNHVNAVLSKFISGLNDKSFEDLDYTAETSSTSSYDFSNCGSYNIPSELSNEQKYQVGAMMINLITTIQASMGPASKAYCDAANGCTSATNDTCNDSDSCKEAISSASTAIYTAAESFVSQAELYKLTEKGSSYQTETSSGTTIKVTDIMYGGWAMAASSYYHFAKRLDMENREGDENTSPLTGNTVSDSYYLKIKNIPAYNKDYPSVTGEASSCSSIDDNGCSSFNDFMNLQITNKYISMTASTTTNDTDITPCLGGSEECTNIVKYIGSYTQDSDGSVTYNPGNAITEFYKSYDVPSIPKTFLELEKGNSACSIPFTQQSDCTDMETKIGIALGSAFLVGVVVIGLIPVFKTAAITIGATLLAGTLVVGTAAYGFYAMAENVTDFTEMMIDPNKLYPQQLSFDIQTFTFLLAKSWYDTFAYNRFDLFLHPIATIAGYGWLITVYSISFIIRIGTDTFNADMSAAFSFFIRKFYIGLPIFMGRKYSTILYDYGMQWLLVGTNPGMQGIIADSFFEGIWKDAPFLALPFPFWILFIPMWAIIGGFSVVAGIGTKVLYYAAQIMSIFDVSDFLLKIQFFINSRWNPLYFAVAVPIIVTGTTFAFILPLYPVIVYTMVVITWATFYIEAVLAIPIILFGMTNPKGQSLLGEAQQSLMVFLILYLRPILTVLGLVFSSIVSSLCSIFFAKLAMPLLNRQIAYWVNSSNYKLSSAVMVIVAMVMFVYLFQQLLIYTFSIIYKVPNAMNSWIGVPPAGGGEEEQRMQEITEQFKQVSSQLAQAGTQVAGTTAQAGQIMDPNARKKEVDQSIRQEGREEKIDD